MDDKTLKALESALQKILKGHVSAPRIIRSELEIVQFIVGSLTSKQAEEWAREITIPTLIDVDGSNPEGHVRVGSYNFQVGTDKETETQCVMIIRHIRGSKVSRHLRGFTGWSIDRPLSKQMCNVLQDAIGKQSAMMLKECPKTFKAAHN